ncbi:MAG: hypothetical protein ACLFP7_09295 [Thiohalospira sp.]
MHTTLRRLVAPLLVVGLGSLSATAAAEDDYLKPFILADGDAGSVEEAADDAVDAVEEAGFRVAGRYNPYDDTEVIAITHSDLREAAAATDQGGYAAALRIGVTSTDEGTQVSYTNPAYLANAYRLDSELSETAEELEEALGRKEAFGSSEELTAEDLREYHYMAFMPYFDDPWNLGEFDSHEEAVDAVAAGLEDGAGDTGEVYRVELPGRDQVLFGVSLGEDVGKGGDAYVMDKIDFTAHKHTPHLPYEVLVDGNEVKALAAKFRIAMNFPDLDMTGDNSFMAIRPAPDAIKEALTAVVEHGE